MVNVDWVNRRGSHPPSILLMKGDLEIWLSDLLIAKDGNLNPTHEYLAGPDLNGPDFTRPDKE